MRERKTVRERDGNSDRHDDRYETVERELERTIPPPPLLFIAKFNYVSHTRIGYIKYRIS